MASKYVDVPNLGTIEFPDSMSDADIATAIRKQTAGPTFADHAKSAGQGVLDSIMSAIPVRPTPGGSGNALGGYANASNLMVPGVEHPANIPLTPGGHPDFTAAASQPPPDPLYDLRGLLNLVHTDPARAIGQALPFTVMGALTGAAGGDPGNLQSPITSQPRMPLLSDVLEKWTPDAARAIHPNLKEATGYQLLRQLTGMRLRSPIKPGPPDGVPSWAQPGEHNVADAAARDAANPAPTFDPDFDTPSQLPSGRVPGTGEPASPSPFPPPRNPDARAAILEAQSRDAASASDSWGTGEAPAPPTLPSGRAVGPIRTPPPATRADPLWKILNGVTPEAGGAPEFSSIPSVLPSGRVPGTGAPRVLSPEEAAADVSRRLNLPEATPQAGTGASPASALSDTEARHLEEWRINTERKATAGAQYFYDKKITPAQLQQWAAEAPPASERGSYGGALKDHAKAFGYPRGISKNSLPPLLEKLKAFYRD